MSQINSDHSSYVRSINDRFSVRDLEAGVCFDTDGQQEEDDDFSDECWWPNERLAKHVDVEEDEIHIPDDKHLPFDELMTKMESLTDDRGVLKRILRHGSDATIADGQTISYHCEAFIEGADEPFDSTILRERPFLHRINFSDDHSTLVPGLLIAIKTMKRGEIAQVMVMPDYAYGPYGCPPRVPPNSPVLYKLEILRIHEPGTLANFGLMTDDERSQLTFQDVLKMCNDERVTANTYFKEKMYKQAVIRYRKTIDVLERYFYANENDENEANDLLLKMYCNAANGYNLLQKFHSAMSMCKRALAIQPKHLKALYQYAKAKRLNGDYETARFLLMQANSIKPNDACVSAELRSLEKRIKLDGASEKELMKKMSAGLYSGDSD